MPDFEIDQMVEIFAGKFVGFVEEVHPHNNGPLFYVRYMPIGGDPAAPAPAAWFGAEDLQRVTA